MTGSKEPIRHMKRAGRTDLPFVFCFYRVRITCSLSERDLHEFLFALLKDELAVLEVSLCN